MSENIWPHIQNTTRTYAGGVLFLAIHSLSVFLSAPSLSVELFASFSSSHRKKVLLSSLRPKPLLLEAFLLPPSLMRQE